MIFNSYFFSTVTMVMRTRPIATLYVHCEKRNQFLNPAFVILSSDLPVIVYEQTWSGSSDGRVSWGKVTSVLCVCARWRRHAPCLLGKSSGSSWIGGWKKTRDLEFPNGWWWRQSLVPSEPSATTQTSTRLFIVCSYYVLLSTFHLWTLSALLRNPRPYVE